jgi:hypothetical protein
MVCYLLGFSFFIIYGIGRGTFWDWTYTGETFVELNAAENL